MLMEIGNIGLIGYGEVGKIFGAGLQGKEGVDAVRAWDLKFANAATSEAERGHAARAGIGAENSMAALCQRSDLIISAVTASNTFAVAQEAATHIRRGSVFL